MSFPVFPPSLSLERGVQLTKDLAYEVMQRASAQNQLDKLWADTLLTNGGINAGSSSGYSYRGASNYDVIVNPGGTRESQTNHSVTVTEVFSNVAASERGCGQTFQASASYSLAGFKTYLQKLGAPTGNLIPTLYATSAGIPTGAPLATAPAVDVSTISTTETLYSFTFSTPYSVVNGTTYAIVMERSGAYTGDGSNHINFRGINTNPYAGGTKVTKSNADVWTTGAADDCYFETTEAAASSAVIKSITLTMPSAITSVIVFADVTNGPASLVRISSDGGSSWTTISSANIGKVVSVPSGTSVILEITLTGTMELESWGVAGV